MKRFEPNENNVYTPQTTIQSENKSKFDISQLLQILQKLNLNTLFNKQNQDTQNTPTPNYPQIRQDLMRSENLKQAQISIQNHREFVEKMNENNKI